MCTANLPRTVELYTQVFGFADGRGEVLSGHRIAEIQELGDSASAIVWWLVGRTDFLQLELFQHSVPAQAPQPEDWSPADHGWVRWGLAVHDFDACLDRLGRFGVPLLTEPTDFGEGIRRVCFRDPHVGCIVEIIEDGSGAPGGERPSHHPVDPAIVYATVSVPDLEVARVFFARTLGMPEVDASSLHTVAMESLWGLGDAQRDALVVRAGDSFVEIVQYVRPIGRAKPDGYRLSDQGLMNVAVGYRQRADLPPLVETLSAAGSPPTSPLLDNQLPAGAYVHAPDGTSVEVLAVPPEFDSATGFAPRADSLLKLLHPNAIS